MQTKSIALAWVLALVRLSVARTVNLRNGFFSPSCFDQDQCMSAWECRTQGGISVSVCLSNHVFGACCRFSPPEITTISESTVAIQDCGNDCNSPSTELSSAKSTTTPSTILLNSERDDHYFVYVTRHRPYVFTRRPVSSTYDKLSHHSTQGDHKISVHHTVNRPDNQNAIKVQSHSGSNEVFLATPTTLLTLNDESIANILSSFHFQQDKLTSPGNENGNRKITTASNEPLSGPSTELPLSELFNRPHIRTTVSSVVTRLPLSNASIFPLYGFLPPRRPPVYETPSSKPTVSNNWIIQPTEAPEEVNWNTVIQPHYGPHLQTVQTTKPAGLHTTVVGQSHTARPWLKPDTFNVGSATWFPHRDSLTSSSETVEHNYYTKDHTATTQPTKHWPTKVTSHIFSHAATVSSTYLGNTHKVPTHFTTRGAPWRHRSTLPTVASSTKSDVRLTDYKNECGVRPLAFDGRIVGGSPSTFGQWPWQVLVKEVAFLGFFSKNKCGGVLISPLYVLTAAHCRPGFFKTFMVAFGEHDLSTDQDVLPVVERNVRRVHQHPDFVVSTFENDLALLELEKPIEFQLHIVPICLPTQGQDFTGSIGVVSGFGRLSSGGRHATVLNHVSLPILSKKQCQEYFAASRTKVSVKDSYLCAGNKEGGKDSCEGDSGGPLAVEGPDGRWVLAGIVSNGIKCALPNSPGIYTKIANFVDWIKKKIS